MAEYTFYFNEYTSTTAWTGNPANITDDDVTPSTFGSTNSTTQHHVLKGNNSDYKFGNISKVETRVFYGWSGSSTVDVGDQFIGYQTALEFWTGTPSSMVGNGLNYAYSNATGRTQTLSGYENLYSGTSLGTIQDVYIVGFCANELNCATGFVGVIPIFSAGEGNIHYLTGITSPAFNNRTGSSIYGDPNAPNPWTWEAIRDLKVRVVNSQPGTGGTTRIRLIHTYVKCYNTAVTALKATVLFSGVDTGTPHALLCTAGTAGCWSTWEDITSEPNAPANWGWQNVKNIDLDLIRVTHDNPPTSTVTTVYKAEIKVTTDFSGKDVTYLDTATQAFQDLQSNLATPFWEVGLLVSGTATSTYHCIGQAYSTGNDVISIGAIDREKSYTISGTDKLVAGDLTIRLNNYSGSYSPLNPNSIFYNKDYLNSELRIYAGFIATAGTAMVVPQGKFLLNDLSLDGQNVTAELHCKDKLKYGLEKYIGLPDVSGTSNARIFTGTCSAKSVIIDLLSGIGLTASEYDITAGVDFANLSFSGKTYGEAIAKTVAASEGFIYVDNAGKVRFKQTTQPWGTARPVWDLKTNTNIIKTNYNISADNLINEVGIHYTEDKSQYCSINDKTDVPKGKTFITDNQSVLTYARAQSLVSRNLADFNVPTTFLEVENLWYPAMDLGDYFTISDPSLYFSGTPSHTFEVYKIRNDFMTLKQKVYAREIYAGQKWGYFSDTGASVTSVTFSTTGSGNWRDQFCFYGYDSGTAAAPGFDTDGNADNVLDSSGSPAENLEQPFIFG